MSGVGSVPFGSSAFGLCPPMGAPAVGGAPTADPTTGLPTGARKIDPRTKDYVLVNGSIAGMSAVRQFVLLAVSTTKGSSAMRSLGQELASIDRISGNFVRRVDTTLRAAVQHIVNRGLIVVVETKVELVRPGVARARLRWRDLSTGLEDETLVAASTGALAPSP